MVKIVKPNIKFKKLDPMPKKIDKLVQHHMAHPSWDIYDVHNFHKNTNGWNGIGYNYWIAFDGTIYEGRGLHYGAGVRGHNHHTLHIGYQGDFTKQKMTDAQLKSGIELNKWLMSKLKLSANAICGHNDLVATACPGKNFRMQELKNGVSKSSSKPKKTTKKSSKSISQMADEVIAGKHGSGHSNRRKSLGISASEYAKVRAEVNRRLTGKAPKKTIKKTSKSISQMATEVIQGKHGVGHDKRRKSLGVDKATYEKVRREVNRRLK